VDVYFTSCASVNLAKRVGRLFFHNVPYATACAYYALSLGKGGKQMALGGIAIVVVIILLLIAMGIVF